MQFAMVEIGQFKFAVNWDGSSSMKSDQWSLIQAKAYREARNSEPENVEDDDAGKIPNSWMSSHTTL